MQEILSRLQRMHGSAAQVGKGVWGCTGCRRHATQVRGDLDVAWIGEGMWGLSAAWVRKSIWECIRGAVQFKEGMWWCNASQEGCTAVCEKCQMSWEWCVGINVVVGKVLYGSGVSALVCLHSRRVHRGA